jgi:hypothetical protein
MAASFPPTPTHVSKDDCRESFFAMQSMILSKQEAGEPFFVGRLSGNEPFLCTSYVKYGSVDRGLIQNMLFGAGIQFSNQKDLEDYINTYTRSFDLCDMVGVWSGGAMYSQGCEFYEHIQKLRSWTPICAPGIEPFHYIFDERYAFDKIFENRKVLILSSHSKTITGQLDKRDKVFKRPIFPASCKIYVHKPPQQNGGNHDGQSWRAHFDKFKTEIETIKTKFFDKRFGH